MPPVRRARPWPTAHAGESRRCRRHAAARVSATHECSPAPAPAPRRICASCAPCCDFLRFSILSEGHRASQETVPEHGTLRAAVQKSNTHTKRHTRPHTQQDIKPRQTQNDFVPYDHVIVLLPAHAALEATQITMQYRQFFAYWSPFTSIFCICICICI